MVILAADVGNTDAVFGLIENGVILQSFRLKSKIPRTSDELDHFLKAYQKADRLVFCSVVPEWSELLQEYALQNGISILEVRHNIQLPFQFDYDSPETLGHDRIANAAAAVEIYGENIIVVDFGTAITFCSICNRMYKGGCIIPGIHTAFDSLSKLTAQLPKVGFSHSSKLPAKNTIQALEAGAFYGYRGMIREILEEIEKNLSWSQRPLRIATGGIVDKLAFNEDLFDVLDRELTLRGLWHLHLLNEN